MYSLVSDTFAAQHNCWLSLDFFCMENNFWPGAQMKALSKKKFLSSVNYSNHSHIKTETYTHSTVTHSLHTCCSSWTNSLWNLQSTNTSSILVSLVHTDPWGSVRLGHRERRKKKRKHLNPLSIGITLNEIMKMPHHNYTGNIQHH